MVQGPPVGPKAAATLKLIARRVSKLGPQFEAMEGLRMMTVLVRFDRRHGDQPASCSVRMECGDDD